MNHEVTMPLLVFIGGQSGSGKSTIAERLKVKLKNRAETLSMDHYYKQRPDEIDPLLYRKTTNFDTPEMIDFDLFLQHLAKLTNGETVHDRPIFSFESNQRDKQKTETIKPAEIIIIEGIFAQYCFKHLLSHKLKEQSLSINVASNYFNVVERRQKRDQEQRGRSAEEVTKNEQKYVGPGYFKWTASSAAGSDLYIANDFASNTELEHYLDAEVNEIITEIEKALKNNLPHKTTPKLREMLASSHLLAGTLNASEKTPDQFTRYFNGAFGVYDQGFFNKKFSQEEIKRSNLIANLRQYIAEIELDAYAENEEHLFKFCQNENKTSEANYYLAKKLLTNLIEYPQKSPHSLCENILEQRNQIIEKKALKNQEACISAKDMLHRIIEQAKELDSQPVSLFSYKF